jgi:uncharacterized protein
MNCPLCLDSVLDVSFHSGIELDICPTCRGVWLDRGELDRIAAGTGRDMPHTRPDPHGSLRPDGRFDHDDFENSERNRDGPSRDDRRSKKRKKSLGSRLGDVFEEIIDM